jgi:hypothetical protein
MTFVIRFTVVRNITKTTVICGMYLPIYLFLEIHGLTEDVIRPLTTTIVRITSKCSDNSETVRIIDAEPACTMKQLMRMTENIEKSRFLGINIYPF